MNTLQIYADTAMCFCWILTYILVLISTIKTASPVLPTITCVIIFPWEFVATVRNIIFNSTFNYAFAAQVLWVILEILIINQLLFKVNTYNKTQTFLYLIALACNICLMFYIFTIPNGMLFTSYFNTIIGILFWVGFTASSPYPKTRLNFLILVIKLVADSLGAVAYYGATIPCSVMSILLPVIHTVHIIVFITVGRQRHSSQNVSTSTSMGDSTK